MPRLLGISHVDLTVSDCDRSAQWWHDVVGFTLVNSVHEDTFECRSLIHPSGVAVTLMTHSATAGFGAFDERRVGLDHLAFQVTDVEELKRWSAIWMRTGFRIRASSTSDTDPPSYSAVPTMCSSSSTYTRIRPI